MITGGAAGIGLAAAKRFIEEGAFVFIFGRRQAALDAAAAELGRNARAVKGSVSNEAERGTLDIVFANAGVGRHLKLGEITARHSDETFDTNVKGTIFTVQKALPLMGKGCSIILTGFERWHHGRTCVHRRQREQGGRAHFARGWTLELKDRNIRVNSMSPGPAETPALETTTGLTQEQAEQAAAQFVSQVPMGRRGRAEEIADAVTFLASDESSFITGVDLAVDGGMAQV